MLHRQGEQGSCRATTGRIRCQTGRGQYAQWASAETLAYSSLKKERFKANVRPKPTAAQTEVQLARPGKSRWLPAIILPSV
jgi:hypothetical protein